MTSSRNAGRAALVVLAGGSGTRLGAALNKVYLPLAGRKVISWSFVRAAQVPEIGHFVLVVRHEDAQLARETLRDDVPGLAVALVEGGASRHESEQAALDHLRPLIEAGTVDVVAIHDGARPLAEPDVFRAVVGTAARVGGALPAIPADDVIGVDADGRRAGGPPAHRADHGPRRLLRVQTPQAFRAAELLAAYARARTVGYQGTDTASSIEAFSDLAVQVVPGSRRNIKITYSRDVVRAERLLVTSVGSRDGGAR